MVASIIFPALIPAGDSGYTIENAIWLDGGADYLNKTFSGTGTNRMKFTFSCWFKLGALGATGTLLSCDDTSSDAEFMFWVQSDGTIRISNYVGGTNELSLISERLLRDPTAWYHLILSANTDSVTPSASTIKLYLNGVQIPDADLSTHTYPDEDFEFSLGNAFDHEVGRYALSNNNLWNGYIAEMVFVDGNNLAHTDFGEFDSNGVWVPKDPSTNIDDYGNNGFLLQFKENGSGQDANGIGADTSEKDNHWAVGGGAVQTNQVTDTPTDDSDNNIGNYATLNPLDAATTTLSNGNVTWASSGSSGWQAIRSTQGVSTGGKVYFEVRADESSANYAISVGTGEVSLTAAPGATNGVASVIQPAGNTWEKFDGSTSSRTLGVTTGTVWGFAVDFDNQDLYLSKDGQWWNGSAFSGGTGPGTIWDDTLSKTAGPLFLICHGYNAENTHTARFRNADWSYSAPANYTSLNTANITAPTVKNPDDGFVFITLEDGDTIEASLATARSGWSSYIDVFKKEADDEDYDVRFSDDSGNSMHFNTDAAAGSELTLASSVNYSAWSWRVGAAYGCYTAEISHDNSSATNQAHGLGSGAKSAVAKRSDSTGDWYVSHPNMSCNGRWNEHNTKH